MTPRSVAEALELLVEPFEDEPDAWADVLRRAGAVEGERRSKRRAGHRLVAVAAAAVAALVALGLSPVGAAVARGVGDFSAWLTGSPGEPASESAQRAFDEANARSWSSFPDGSELRRLIETKAAGGSFELFGFRTGDSLCLRVVVAGFSTEGPATGCAPLADLRRAEAPAVTVLVDYGFGRQDLPPNEEGAVPARASATFGVVADGVAGVEVETSEGRVEAIVDHNAFLAVTGNPPLGTRSKELLAVGEHGGRAVVPLAESPFGDRMPRAAPGTAPGPTEVERKVEGGTVGWLHAHEPRGQSFAEAGLSAPGVFAIARVEEGSSVRFARVVEPDPDSLYRMILGLIHVGAGSNWFSRGEHLCVFTLSPGEGSGGGCSPVGRFFERGPFSLGLSSAHGGSQHVLVNGLASDDVARMALYLRDGERVDVPLKDNAYLIEVARLDFPIRLVAYDDADRVIGIETYSHDPLSSPGPQPVEGKQRIVKRVTAADGTEGTLRVGPSTAGTVCWRVAFRSGAGGGGCQPKGTEPRMSLGASGGSGAYVSGSVSPGVVRVELRFRDGTRLVVTPVQGFVLDVVTPRQGEAGLELAIGFDRAGRGVERERFRRPPG